MAYTYSKLLSALAACSMALSAHGAEVYWATTRSIFNSMAEASFTDGLVYNYPVEIDVQDNVATITGLFKINSPYLREEYPVQGIIDTENSTLTIECLGYNENTNPDDYTCVAEFKDNSGSFYGVLMAGNVASDGAINLVDQLVMDILEDGSLVPRTNFGIYSVDPGTGGGLGFYDYYLACLLEKFGDEPKLFISQRSVDYSEQYVTMGQPSVEHLTLTNISNPEVEFTVESSSPQLKATPMSGTMDSGESINFDVILTPEAAGLFTGNLSILDGNGSVLTQIDVKAVAHEGPNYQVIVSEGEFQFSLDPSYPFLVEDDIEGVEGTVAISSNVETGTSSSLTANFTVPEGKVGLFEFAMIAQTRQPNSVEILLDGWDKVKYNQGADDEMHYFHQMHALKAGNHKAEFTNLIYMDWYTMGYSPTPGRCMVQSIGLKLYDASDKGVIATDSEIDFGQVYFDNLTSTITLYATLLNIGSEPMQVLSANCPEEFSVTIPEESVESLSAIEVPITLHANALGVYDGLVEIITSAGSVSVRCVAEAIKLPYDYDAIVTEGKFSFNTSMAWPFVVEGNQAWNSTSGKDVQGEESWLEAYFEVPEGQTATLQWTAYNSSNDWFTFMDNNSVLTDGTIITLDGESQEFAGESNCSSAVFDPSGIEVEAGLHCLRFDYIKKSSVFEGEDRCVVSNLILELDSNSIGSITDNAELISIDRYDAQGRRCQDAMGFVIEVRHYSDGTVTTQKIINK